MNYDAQLKLQAFLDGELSEREAAEVKNWLAADRDGQLLLAELKNTSAALTGHEEEVKLPESRDFFWSKIEREIERAQPTPAQRPRLSFMARLRRQLVPLSGVAIVTLVFSVVTLHSLTSAGSLAEMEMLSDDMGAYTYRDQANKMTFVWFYDRTDNSEFTQTEEPATVPIQ